MKIAICLSGLPRTGLAAASLILPYFDLPGVQIDYFCHTWDTDMVKTIDGRHVASEITNEQIGNMLARYNPVAQHIDSQSVLKLWPNRQPTQHGQGNHWSPLFYSCMMANHLKRCHEQVTGERYDIVVKSRYDVVFQPGTKFQANGFEPMDIYTSHAGNFPYEFNRKNFSDVLFAGTSEVMDIACDYFRYIAFITPRSSDHMVGPGVGMHKYLNDRNITPKTTLVPETILRTEALTNMSWSNIVAIHQSYYT